MCALCAEGYFQYQNNIVTKNRRKEEEKSFVLLGFWLALFFLLWLMCVREFTLIHKYVLTNNKKISGKYFLIKYFGCIYEAQWLERHQQQVAFQ